MYKYQLRFNQMSLDFSGSIGAKTVNARLSAGHVTLKHKDTVMFDGPLWLVCFQRVSTRLKTCDVVYISGSQCHVHTIDRAQLDSIQDLVTCPVYNVGADPLPWKRFCKDASKYGWDVTDWQHLLEEDEVSEDNDSEDGEWVPSGSESEDDYFTDED